MKLVTLFTVAILVSGTVVRAGAQDTASVYKANCAPCHGAAGDANTPAGKNFKVPSFSSDAVLKQADASLLEVTKNGKGKMPAWHDKLSDDRLKELISFIHTLQKK